MKMCPSMLFSCPAFNESHPSPKWVGLKTRLDSSCRSDCRCLRRPDFLTIDSFFNLLYNIYKIYIVGG